MLCTLSQEANKNGHGDEHTQPSQSIIKELEDMRQNPRKMPFEEDVNVNTNCEGGGCGVSLSNHEDARGGGSLGACGSLYEASSEKLVVKAKQSSVGDYKEKESSVCDCEWL